ncbi:helix-turn-helix domain-containing protein [Levilactobacillus spicheri]
MSGPNYERVRLNARFPAMLLLQNLTGQARTIPLHWHRSLELDLLTAGSLDVTVAGQTTTLTAPAVLVINTATLHAMTPNTARIQAITLLISYDFIKQALPNYDDLAFDLQGRSATAVRLKTCLAQIGEWYRQRPNGYQLLIGEQIDHILYLLTTQAVVPRPIQPTTQCDYRIQATLTSLDTSYQFPVSMRRYADRYHLTLPYFSRLFHRETGQSFREYLLNLRVEMAQKQLSQTSMKIIDIALANGFGSAQRLIAAFEKLYGLSPTRYRRQERALRPTS